MEMVISSLEMLRRWGRKLGPYLILEILMPGGTLLALLLFLYRRRATVPVFLNFRRPDVEFGLPRNHTTIRSEP